MPYVYIIGTDEGPYKIGVTNDLSKRLAALKTATPLALHLLYAVDFETREIADRVEKNCHVTLYEFRVSGEWFNCPLEKAKSTIHAVPKNELLPWIPWKKSDLEENEPMLGAAFAAWLAFMRSTRKWSGAKCAVALGVHGNQIKRWRDNGAPPYVGLACSAIAQGLPPWEPA